MTLPARFDAMSSLSLAMMHLALIPATLLALGALTPRWHRPTPPGNRWDLLGPA
jgi:hypothetical protein